MTEPGSGNQNNKVIGQMDNIGPYSTPEQMLTVTMAFDSGSGYQPSQIEADSFNMDGLAGTSWADRMEAEDRRVTPTGIRFCSCIGLTATSQRLFS